MALHYSENGINFDNIEVATRQDGAIPAYDQYYMADTNEPADKRSNGYIREPLNTFVNAIDIHWGGAKIRSSYTGRTALQSITRTSELLKCVQNKVNESDFVKFLNITMNNNDSSNNKINVQYDSIRNKICIGNYFGYVYFGQDDPEDIPFDNCNLILHDYQKPIELSNFSTNSLYIILDYSLLDISNVVGSPDNLFSPYHQYSNYDLTHLPFTIKKIWSFNGPQDVNATWVNLDPTVERIKECYNYKGDGKYYIVYKISDDNLHDTYEGNYGNIKLEIHFKTL